MEERSIVDTASGEGLDRLAQAFGLQRRLEADASLRSRIRLVACGRFVPLPGSLQAISEELTAVIEELRPTGVWTDTVQSGVGRYWLALEHQRVRGWFGRLRWWWGVWRQLRVAP